MKNLPRTAFLNTICRAWSARGHSRVEIMIERGKVLAYDDVGEIWTTTHAISDTDQETIRAMAANAAKRRQQTGGQLGFVTFGDTYPWYAVVTFGSPRNDKRGAYQTLQAARIAAQGCRGGTCSQVQILGCQTKEEAEAATIHDELPRVAA